MVRIIMHGCNGKMGQTITNIVKEDADAQIVAGIDLFDGIKNEYPVFKSLADCDVDADVVIDAVGVSVSYAAGESVSSRSDRIVFAAVPVRAVVDAPEAFAGTVGYLVRNYPVRLEVAPYG
ncbi:MAG: hypothetical protein J6X66_12485, partial [Lachnospiraceae bacterium]|nr:hypothetical protein [Lachnospiraceae bacterium]